MIVETPLNYFNNFKQKILKKSPLEKYLMVRRLNMFLLRLIGVDIMDEGYKFRFETWIPMYLVLNYFSLMFYTLYYYRNEPFRAIQSTPTSGQVLPVLLQRWENQGANI